MVIFFLKYTLVICIDSLFDCVGIGFYVISFGHRNISLIL